MDTPSVKEEARSLVEALPDGSTWEDLTHWIYVRQAIEAGMEDSEAGRAVSVDEVRFETGHGARFPQYMRRRR